MIRHFEETAEQLDGRLPSMLASNGFTELHEVRHFTTIFGPLVALKAIKLAER
ncbi:MAG: hypothetical protein H6654_09580 [Ardenticatenaceae bacterium]|nr:hypothetical protein [Ardenticatenaceae bacterium]